MSERSKTDVKARRLHSKSSGDFGRERLVQTAEGLTSLSDLRLKSRKEEARKPIYLIRYE